MKKYLIFLAFLFLTSLSYSQNIVANYELNGNGIDSSPNNFDANNNGAMPTEDRFGNMDGAVYLDGINDHLEIPNHAELNFGTCDFAISVWIKTGLNNMQMIIHNGSSGLEPQYWLRIKDYSTAFIDLKFVTSDGVPGSPFVTYNNESIFNDNWHHIVIQRKGFWHEIYFDGTLVSADENPEIKNIVNEHNILIGAQHPHPTNGFPNIYNHFRGAIDDLVFFKGSLTKEQVEDLFNGEITSTVETDSYKNNIQIYPNPTSSNIEIKGDKLINKVVRIVDSSGRTIKLFQLFENNINVSDLPSGIYFLVFNIENQMITKQFIKE